jgi:hypothetical protein
VVGTLQQIASKISNGRLKDVVAEAQAAYQRGLDRHATTRKK